MANPEQIPPLSARRRDVLERFQTKPGDTRQKGYPPYSVSAWQSMVKAIALKASIGSSTQTYVSNSEYIAIAAESKSFSDEDISLCMPLVPIRDDPEMVAKWGFLVAEAGFQRWGVAA